MLMHDVLSTIEVVAASKLLIRMGRKSKPIVPAWNDEIEPFQDNTHFWHAIWISIGKPLNNQLYSMMKRTQNLYHLVIRKQGG